MIVLFADTPLVEAATLRRLTAALDAGAGIAVLGFEPADATGYGRLIVDAEGRVTAIREHKDASEAERRIRLCNAGAMAFRVAGSRRPARAHRQCQRQGRVLPHRRDRPRGRDRGSSPGRSLCTEDEAMGVNSREQLAAAEAVFQRRARARAMEAGATLIAPETVWFSFDTTIGRDVTIEPNVFFGPGVVVEDGVADPGQLPHGRRPHPQGCARRAVRAPAAGRRHRRRRAHRQLRRGQERASWKTGAKANHLAYIGDGRVGEGANIGAGTIFCNYDGFDKHFTDVGKGVFVGSNSSLVAPVKIGDGAYIGSGSVITKDVDPDALALERSAQEERPGWAAKFRHLHAKARRNEKRR